MHFCICATGKLTLQGYNTHFKYPSLSASYAAIPARTPDLQEKMIGSYMPGFSRPNMDVNSSGDNCKASTTEPTEKSHCLVKYRLVGCTKLTWNIYGCRDLSSLSQFLWLTYVYQKLFWMIW